MFHGYEDGRLVIEVSTKWPDLSEAILVRMADEVAEAVGRPCENEDSLQEFLDLNNPVVARHSYFFQYRPDGESRYAFDRSPLR